MLARRSDAPPALLEASQPHTRRKPVESMYTTYTSPYNVFVHWSATPLHALIRCHLASEPSPTMHPYNDSESLQQSSAIRGFRVEYRLRSIMLS